MLDPRRQGLSVTSPPKMDDGDCMDYICGEPI